MDIMTQSRLVATGRRMATWMRHVAEYENVPELYREEMKRMVETWDKIEAQDSTREAS